MEIFGIIWMDNLPLQVLLIGHLPTTSWRFGCLGQHPQNVSKVYNKSGQSVAFICNICNICNHSTQGRGALTPAWFKLDQIPLGPGICNRWRRAINRLVCKLVLKHCNITPGLKKLTITSLILLADRPFPCILKTTST